ncbi:transglycosylase domain-containing protein [Bifidobacterium animalis]|uniref:transglycosylase domain-containing protein n=1 Tax=Bifidobacterium animalis TaxID=28025 RepID=UPI003F9194A4
MVYQARTVSSSSSSPRAAHKASTSHRAPKRGQNAPKGPKKRTNRKKGLWWKILLGVLGGLLAIGIGLFTYLYVTTDIPQPEKVAIAEKTTVYYNDGTTEIGSFSEQNREIIDCSVLPDYVGNAIVASEDRSFYRNGGIDIMGMARALYNNLTTGSRQGGSTITQQYAERYYLGDTTSYSGKIREAILAMKIANSQDKQQVLCNYMNTIYLGRGAYGIQAAAKAYFGKEAKDLTVDEAAMIAGIIPAPSMWDPAVNEAQAKSRFTRVIGIMREDGYITGQQASEAKFPETKPVSVSNDLAGPNGYLLTTVENELVASKAFTKDELETGGYKIVSTLDPNMQKIMQTVGDDRPEGMPESIQVGGIALDQKTGSVKAIYGGSDYLKHQLNNATQANFQPGSTMKPFGLLGAAMDDVNFNTMFNGNSPERFETTPGTWAEVPNALNMSWGTINLKQATANSVNTVFMNVNQHLTPKKFAQIAHDAGISGDIQEDTLYNILGINSLTVWDLAQGHSTIANDGTKNTLHIVDRVLKGDKEMYKPDLGTKQVFDANDCQLVQNAMLGTTQYGTAAGTAARLGRQVAGKSGTANDETAASFVGYTPSLMNVWAIWNPGENGESQIVPEFAGYGVSSTGYPSHLFTEFMAQALAGQPAETFATPVDNGKIGGPNGDWGLGGQRYVPSTNNGTQQQQQNEQQQTAPENTKTPEQPQPGNDNTNGNGGGETGGNPSDNNGGSNSGDSGNSGNQNGNTGGNTSGNNGSNNSGSNSGDSGNSGNQNGNTGGNNGSQNNTGNGEQTQR